MVRALVIVALLVAAGLGTAGTALADPPEPTLASCLGIEAAGISPPGSSSEAPGGMNDFVPLPGSFVKFAAQLKLQTHEDCDAALE